MIILYDHQVFTWQTYGGISRYFYELLKAYKDNSSIETILTLKYSNNHFLLNDEIISTITSMPSLDDFLFGVRFKGKGKLFRLSKTLGLIENTELVNKKQSLQIIKSGQYDILHPTYYDPYFLDFIDAKPFVLTIHDMIHELFCEIFPKYKDKTIHWKKLLANKAVAIIAVSENTKNDIIRLYGIDENKITVIYHGNSLFVDETNKTMINKLPERYILYVGDRWAYKNFEYFLNAIIPILKKDKDLYLVCGGSHPFNKNEIRLLEYYRCENRVLHVKVNDNDTLIGLYKNALAFVFPSLYEGFGIPVLESFSCGCPVVLSNSSSLPEVAGEAGVYFNPEDETSIRDAILSVIYKDEVRDNLIKKGYKQLEKFSWEKTAFETRRVYESIL